MMYENGVLSNYRRSWFLYRLVLNVILLGCFLLNFEGAEGQVQVSILNDTLDFFGDRSELNVFIDSTLTFRVIWRNSSWDEPNRPTDPSSILIQNLNGAVTCPVTGDCGRFDMNSEYGLVLNGVIIEDGNQTLWCDVSAGDGNGFDSIVPVVAGWRNHDSDSSVTYDLNNNMLHCTVYNFLPDDNFTLTWMDPEGEVLVSTTKASIYEDIYFSATLSAEPSKSGKKYTCVAEGKAFTFDAFSKEIYVPVCTVCEECGIECCEESCDCNTLCDEPIIPVRPIVIICIVILCAVILMSGGIIIFKAIKASNSTVNVSEQDGKQWVKASEVTKGVFLKWKLSNDKTNCFKVEKQEHKLWRACDKIRPTDTECTIKIPDGKNYLFKVTAVQKCASKNSLHKENEETHKKSEQEDTPVHTTSKEPQQEENPICIIFLVQDFTVRYNTLFISWNSTLSDNFQMKHVKVDYEKQVQGTSPYQRTPENAESIQLMERDLEHLFRVTTVYSNCREKDMDNVRSGKSEEKDFPRTEKKLTIIAHTATPEQVGQASANTAIPQDGRPEPQDQDSANKATPRDDRPELPDLASADKVTLQDDQKDQASKVTELYIKLQLPNDEYNKCIEVETQEYETSTWEPCDNIKDTECHIKLNGKQKYLFKVTAEESVTEKQIC